jgi:hypothetical protein
MYGMEVGFRVGLVDLGKQPRSVCVTNLDAPREELLLEYDPNLTMSLSDHLFARILGWRCNSIEFHTP